MCLSKKIYDSKYFVKHQKIHNILSKLFYLFFIKKQKNQK